MKMYCVHLNDYPDPFWAVADGAQDAIDRIYRYICDETGDDPPLSKEAMFGAESFDSIEAYDLDENVFVFTDNVV